MCDSYVQPNYKCYTCGKIASRAVKNLENATPKELLEVSLKEALYLVKEIIKGFSINICEMPGKSKQIFFGK